MATRVQQEFQLLFQSYKKIRRMYDELGTATDGVRLRTKLEKELGEAETIANRMHEEINQIENKPKREKLRSQLTKTRKEIEQLRKNIEKKKRLNSLPANSNLFETSSGGKFSSMPSDGVLQTEQSIEFQQYNGNIVAAEEREAAIIQIQKDTEEIAEVFEDLRDMVGDQQADVDILEANAEQTAANVKAGAQELDKAAEYQKAKRKKMCMILLCLLVAGGLLAIILAVSN